MDVETIMARLRQNRAEMEALGDELETLMAESDQGTAELWEGLLEEEDS